MELQPQVSHLFPLSDSRCRSQSSAGLSGDQRGWRPFEWPLAELWEWGLKHVKTI